MRRQHVAYLVKITLLFLLYYSTAVFGFRLDAVSGFATLFWLPTGISLAALLLFGYRLLPGIALGALLANMSNGAPLLIACGIAVGNTLEAFIGAYLLKRFIGLSLHLKDSLMFLDCFSLEQFSVHS